MKKINSVFTKIFSTKNSMLSVCAVQKFNNSMRFNKFNLKNFYFQESKHGAGDVS